MKFEKIIPYDLFLCVISILYSAKQLHLILLRVLVTTLLKLKINNILSNYRGDHNARPAIVYIHQTDELFQSCLIKHTTVHENQ